MSDRKYAGYYHTTPGRLRVRVTNLRNRTDTAKSLEILLHSQSGVKHVRANPITANVLINFDPDIISCEDILAGLEDMGHLPILSKREVETETYDISNLGMSLAKVCLKQALKGSPAAVILELL